jgi:hypothetical protein
MAQHTTPDQTGSILIDSDGDSAFGDSDVASETTSLRSAVYNYIYENGRRYHSYRAGAYWCVPLSSVLPESMEILNLMTQGPERRGSALVVFDPHADRRLCN